MNPGNRRTATLRDAPPPQPPFTADDLIAALSVPTGGEGLTSYELSVRIGRPQAWVGLRLRQLGRAGRLELSKAQRLDIDGVTLRLVPVYRLKSAA
jgi:hypothetical protein